MRGLLCWRGGLGPPRSAQGALSHVLTARRALLQFLIICALFALPLDGQTIAPQPLQLAHPQGEAAPPLVLTLQDALERARKFDLNVQSATADAATAREDRAQAKQSLLPTIANTTEYLGTQGNGVLPSGRFVTNDGVHVY